MLAHLPDVEEKKMFRGITFMVDGKMSISVASDEIMCRIDPMLHESVVERNGYRSMIMKGREYKGYVLVNEEGIKRLADFNFWMGLAFDFNKRAKASPKNVKKVSKKPAVAKQ